MLSGSMMRRYIAKLIFKQKCIPWYIIIKWKEFIKFVCVQPFIETIDLERTYRSCLEFNNIMVEIVNSNNSKYHYYLIKNDVDIQFIRKFKDKPSITNKEIALTKYYQEACMDIQAYGNHQNMKDELSLFSYCRRILELYQILKKKEGVSLYLRFINDLIDHYKYGYPSAFKISNTNYYMVYDGHHRLACQYLLGKRFIKAKIIGVINNNHQIELLSSQMKKTLKSGEDFKIRGFWRFKNWHS